jgi:hypothetical protein
MIPMNSPEAPGVIRARLASLRKRKASLDEVIRAVECYVDGYVHGNSTNGHAEEILFRKPQGMAMRPCGKPALQLTKRKSA